MNKMLRKITAVLLVFCMTAGLFQMLGTSVVRAEEVTSIVDSGEMYEVSALPGLASEETESSWEIGDIDEEVNFDLSGSESFLPDSEADSVNGEDISDDGDNELLVEDTTGEKMDISGEVSDIEEEMAEYITGSFELDVNTLVMGDLNAASEESASESYEWTEEEASGLGKVAIEAIPEQSEPEENLELNASEPGVRASMTSVELMKKAKTIISLSCYGTEAYGDDYGVDCTVMNGSICNIELASEWLAYQNGFNLRIISKSAGSTVILVRLYQLSTNRTLANTSIGVKVVEGTHLKLSDTSLTIPMGETRRLIVSGANMPSGICYNVNRNPSFVKTSWTGNFYESGAYLCHYLDFTGVGVGTSTAIISAINTKTGAVVAEAQVKINVVGKPSVSAHTSSLTVKQNEKKSVLISCSGYDEIFNLDAVKSSNICDLSFGTFSNGSVFLNVTGRSAGTATITVKMSALDGTILDTTSFKVTVTAAAPTLTASSTSVSLEPGTSSTVTFTAGNLSGAAEVYFGITGNSCSAEFGVISGVNIPLKITGVQEGTSKVTMYLEQNGATVATASVNVSVSSDAKVTLSQTNLTLTTGSSVDITAGYSDVHVNKIYMTLGVTGNCTAEFVGSWRNHKRTIRITAGESGQSTVRVYLRNWANGEILAYGTIYVNAKAATPYIRFVSEQVTVYGGRTKNITVKFGGYPSDSMLYISSSDYSKCRVYYPAPGNGSQITARIVGAGEGTATVTVFLKDANKNVLAQDSITVNSMGTGVADLSYSLSNSYSGFGYDGSYVIPLNTYKKMFGNTVVAKTLFDAQEAWGGNCFGMSATSGMMETATVVPSTFKSGVSRPFNLKLSNYSSTYWMNVRQFIEGMQISQNSFQLNHLLFDVGRDNNLQQLYNAVKNAHTEPVLIGMTGLSSSGRGKSGHAVLAYAVEEGVSVTEIYIYDPNYPDANNNTRSSNRFISLYKNSSGNYSSWEYEIGENRVWGTGRTHNSITFLTEDEYAAAWSQRGHLTADVSNLLIANVNDLNIYDVEDNLIAQVVDGELVSGIEGMLMVRHLDETQDDCIMMYLPVDFYQIENASDSQELFEVSMTNVMLAAEVLTSGTKVAFAVDDTVEGYENLSLNQVDVTADPGDVYNIQLKSCMDEEFHNITVTGESDGQKISAAMEDGELVLENADLAMVNKDGTITNAPIITASAGDGGYITPEGTVYVLNGKEQTFQITPESRYEIADVLVDGVSVGAQTKYVFTEVTEDHTIEAVFTHEHDWGTGEVKKEATCAETGVREYTCSICQETKEEMIDKSIVHTYGAAEVTKKATCNAVGIKTYTCSVCKAKKEETIAKATVHSYGEWVVTKEATVLEAGNQTRTCSICGKQETQTIDKRKAFIETNASVVKLKKKQSTTGLKVTMGNGDAISSVKSNKKSVVKATILDAEKGTLKLKAQKKTGTATVTISLKSGLSKKIKIKVQSGTVKTTKIAVTDKKVTLKKGETYSLMPVITPFTSQQKVTYSTSNKKIAAVNKKGIITAKKKGTVKITIRSGSKSILVTVKVK